MKFRVAANERNMTPQQKAFDREVQREAYGRLPETCEKVRSILDEAENDIMKDLEIDESDRVSVNIILSRAFIRIRDEVTQEFRTEQMRLINEMLQKRK